MTDKPSDPKHSTSSLPSLPKGWKLGPAYKMEPRNFEPPSEERMKELMSMPIQSFPPLDPAEGQGQEDKQQEKK
jgi:hypothetical protein